MNPPTARLWMAGGMVMGEVASSSWAAGRGGGTGGAAGAVGMLKPPAGEAGGMGTGGGVAPLRGTGGAGMEKALWENEGGGGTDAAFGGSGAGGLSVLPAAGSPRPPGTGGGRGFPMAGWGAMRKNWGESCGSGWAGTGGGGVGIAAACGWAGTEIGQGGGMR